MIEFEFHRFYSGIVSVPFLVAERKVSGIATITEKPDLYGSFRRLIDYLRIHRKGIKEFGIDICHGNRYEHTAKICRVSHAVSLAVGKFLLGRKRLAV